MSINHESNDFAHYRTPRSINLGRALEQQATSPASWWAAGAGVALLIIAAVWWCA